MSCISSMGKIPEGYGLLDRLPMTLPQHTRFKASRLEKMARSIDPNERAAAAGNPNTSAGLLWLLAMDDEVTVREWVARNPNCPAKILHLFASREDDLGAFARWKLEVVK